MAKKENEVKEKKQKNSSYFKEMKAELKKVVWPTPKELVNNTVAVIVFVLIIAAIVFVLDFCFDNVNKYGITKFQEKVQSSFNETDENASSDESTSDENESSSDENAEVTDGESSTVDVQDNTEGASEAEPENPENSAE